ncbi:hypothetical protein [Paraburkholderia antibiotica]|uniref:DUF4148 domain-containing protein n=1 Tax=Paraburkholderia antibiotica TaxID=2728839 RepID=A0A7X9X7X1_9BURK|nr:hypothetical protein [Paraburkholderia antibiotica]NML32592.1 hypothetical protein [Paraburkholderia antibiotica]
MKSLIEAVVIAALIATPLATFAQSNQTRQQEIQATPRAAQAQLDKTDHQPSSAAVRAATQNQVARNSGYGAPANGSSQTGSRMETTASSYSAPVVKYTR